MPFLNKVTASGFITRKKIIYALSGLALIVTLGFGYVFWAGCCSWFENDKVQSFTLDNGLRVIVIPNHKVPAVTHMVWYKIGAMDELPGKTGNAHFLEHLMFKGTSHVPEGEFSSRIAKNGGNDNAFTSWDYTAYFQMISADKLPFVMELEADRMQGLNFSDQAVSKEREVVMEERRMRVDNDPASRLYEKMRESLFQNTAYGRPLIGYQKDIEKLTHNHAMDFYHSYYAPNNAVLVVAGDITPSKLKSLAKQYFGSIPAKSLPERVLPATPETGAERRITLKDEKVQNEEWIRMYLAPSQRAGESKDSYALSILAFYLGGSQTSYLYKTLVVDQKVAVDVSVNYDDLSLGMSTFEIAIEPKPGISLELLENKTEEALEALNKNGITDKDLKRVKDYLTAQVTYSREGFKTMAYIYGQVAMLDLPLSYVDDWEKNIQAVTKEQLLNAGAKILKEDNAVTGYLKPRKG